MASNNNRIAEASTQSELWRVGDLAGLTGVSIRTLHYYDEIGLLVPSRHSDGGHRLYAAADVVRLQQIRSLQQMGFALEEIRECLESPEWAPQQVIERHLERLRGQIAAQQRVYVRMEAIAERLRLAEEVSAGEFIQLIEGITRMEKYYSPEQLEELKQRREMIGDERIRQVEGEWKELMEQVGTEMQKGTDPADPRVQELARRWTGLVQEFTGGNPEIEKSLRTMYQQEETIHGMEVGPMREMGEYIQKAMNASK